MNLTSRKVVKDIMSKCNLNFLHSLGQNFVVNSDVIKRMVCEGGVHKFASVLEIGSGIGTLTKELASVALEVVTVEIDKKLLPLIKENLKEFSNVVVLNNDFLKIDLSNLWDIYFRNKDVFICANLPYYITSAIIIKILNSRLNFNSLTVMVQKEMAQRICAPLGSRNSNALSVLVNYFCEPKYLFNVNRENFVPVPKVDSAVVKLTKFVDSPVKVFDENIFFSTVRESFSKRRKKLRNSVTFFGKISKENMVKILENLSVADLRPENLKLEDFAEISNQIFLNIEKIN